jgi:hypothetical protein
VSTLLTTNLKNPSSGSNNIVLGTDGSTTIPTLSATTITGTGTLNVSSIKNPSSGSNNIVLGTDGSTTIPTLSATTITGTSVRGGITSSTSVASTSGTSIDFTSIPSWVKRVTVMLDGVSANGTSLFRIRLGDSGGIEDTGYFSMITAAASTVSTSDYTSGFTAAGGVAARTYSGMMQIALLSSNTWVAMGTFNDGVGNNYFMSGTKTLSDTLDRIRITTVNGSDTFDAGTINILMEG